MGKFEAGRYVPIDTSDNDTLDDLKHGGAFVLLIATIVAAVVGLLWSLRL